MPFNRFAAMALTFCLLVSSASAQTNGSIVATPESVPESGPTTPFAERGGALPSVMRWLITQDLSLTYLGDEGGVKGYLGEASNGRHQAFYATPDGEHVLVGVLYRSGGQNVTYTQISRMLDRFHDAAALVPGIDVSELEDFSDDDLVIDGPDEGIMDWFAAAGLKITQIGENEGGIPGYAVEALPDEGADASKGVMQFFYVLPDERYAIAGTLMRRGYVNVTGLQVAATQQKFIVESEADKYNGSNIAPGGNPPSPPPAILAVPQDNDVTQQQIVDALTPSQPAAPAPIFEDAAARLPATASDRFYDPNLDAQELLAAANDTFFFTVGKPDLPAVYMVADPQCPFCHQTWSSLKPLVFAGKIQLRVIMIAGLKGSDPLARSILSQPDPSAVWIAGQGSMDNVRIDAPPSPGSQAWEMAGLYLQKNSLFTSAYDVTKTPFLAYVDKDGRAITSIGVPDSFDDYLAAIY